MDTLEIDSVLLSYGQKRILSDVYLRCQTGQTVGILGRNGSGKSSLLKVIFGALKAENQSLRINGQYFEKPFLGGNRISYLSQEAFTPTYLTFSKLLDVFRINPERREFLEGLPEVRQYLYDTLGSLSHGLRKYFEALLLLCTPTQFTLLDEPFSFLSPVLTEDLKVHILNLKKQKGIIVTDHQYENVLSCTDSCYLIKEGRTIPVRNKDDLIQYGYLSGLT